MTHALFTEPPIEGWLAAVEQIMFDAVRIMTSTSTPTAGPNVLGPMLTEHLQSGGKRLRARLAIASGLALGVPKDAAQHWAAACELAHNATLIHDDLQDGDTKRRHRPTLWVTYGPAQAINAGDFLLLLPQMLLSMAACHERQLSLLLVRALLEVIRGQALECSMLSCGDMTLSTYQAAIDGKTGALFALPVHGSALLADVSATAAAAMAAPFACLGRLFQMVDDLIDLYGDKGRAEYGNDIREGKISALVVEHVRRQPQERDWLLAVLRTPREQTTVQQIEQVRQRFVQSAAVAAVQANIAEQAAWAKQHTILPLRPVITAMLDCVAKPVLQLD